MAQQAKRVYTVEHLALQDGTEVEAKPLPIKRLRQAQKKISAAMEGTPKYDEEGNPVIDKDGDHEKDYDDNAVYDAFIDVVLLVMQGQKSCEKFLDPGEELPEDDEDYEGPPRNGRELLEDTIDQDSLYEIVKVSTGYDFLAMTQQVQEILKEGNLSI